jgi:hypothetical protein
MTPPTAASRNQGMCFTGEVMRSIVRTMPAGRL